MYGARGCGGVAVGTLKFPHEALLLGGLGHKRSLVRVPDDDDNSFGACGLAAGGGR